ncbi:hypothetical protein J7T55_015583 [Diaporthe amygdali]|uniref:uncharacterized protein n=1 Tax=Phomopsis amygdali TaxID=1214568 RepID=UPI0022FDC4D8|nr:uncharacterized protein J7T55_015583 [Diaporthe amygdali]KAJ0120848.1 hypothetical protein J7T55_015583 [Diaporthe amygdali]
MAMSNVWEKLRRAPHARGNKENIRLIAVEDLERLLQVFKLEGGTVARLPSAGQHALPRLTPGQEYAAQQPRLAFVLLGMPTPTWLNTNGIDLVNNIDSMFWRAIMNRVYLLEADPRRSLLAASHESRNETFRATSTGSVRSNWLNRLGLAPIRLNYSDLLYLGGFSQGAHGALRDMQSIIPLSLVLGNVVSRVLVNGDVFVRYFAPYEGQPPESPLTKAIADLHGMGPNYARLFADALWGLPQPRLPRTMVFMLSNDLLEWEPQPPSMDHWLQANLVGHNDPVLETRVRMDIIPWIRHIFAGWLRHPDLVPHVPQLFFARIKPRV